MTSTSPFGKNDEVFSVIVVSILPRRRLLLQTRSKAKGICLADRIGADLRQNTQQGVEIPIPNPAGKFEWKNGIFTPCNCC